MRHSRIPLRIALIVSVAMAPFNAPAQGAAKPAAPAPAPKTGSHPTTTATGSTPSFDAMKVNTNVTPTDGTTMGAIRGVQSPDSENARGQTDAHVVPQPRGFMANPPHTLGRHARLKDDPKIGDYIKAAMNSLKGFEIQTSLLAGHKYMVNSCLGVKVNAGEFSLTVPDPDLRVAGDGLVLTFTVGHIAMNAFSLRFRPDPSDVMQPCHFSGAVGVSGGADNVRYELHFDPVLDLERCKIGRMGQVHQIWRIGALHLNPLPQQLSNVAGNMIEDSFTAFANFDLTDRVVAALNGAVGAQCHK